MRKAALNASRVVRVIRGLALSLRPGVTAEGLVQVERWPRISRPRGGRLLLGRRAWLFRGVEIFLESPQARISVGERSFVNRRTGITAAESVTIGDHCAISWDVVISDTDYHDLQPGGPRSAPVHIGDHVWVGARAVILKGVTIGDGAVIAAGSIVTKDVAPGTLVAGNPARPVRTDVTWTQ
jgi:acetyltransferase-like isoleucine patch superfamily enzyme